MKKQGNISILVIFVLLASSLLGILSMNFVQQMIKQSTLVHAYYKAYYLAKAGIELGLTTITTRGPGFNYVVYSGDVIIQDNFLTGTRASLSLSISGTASLLSPYFWQHATGCTDPYILGSGESLIIPFFRDVTQGTIGSLFTTHVHYQNLAHIFDNIDFVPSGTHGDVTYGILILSGDQLSPNGVFFQKGTLQGGISDFKIAFEQYLKTLSDPNLYGDEAYLYQWYQTQSLIDRGFTMYFMISNTSSTKHSFCIDIAQLQPLVFGKLNVLPTDKFFLQSKASYDHQMVVLDALYAQPIPGFLFSTYTSF